mmetsp:Transcript_36478/g.41619  ORF Transcript_36478/g.41619 Transcript_36478/m.41619 type:complete len:410 (+) Transcript_36478:111-1340(+)
MSTGTEDTGMNVVDAMISSVVSIGMVAGVAVLYHTTERNYGKCINTHACYWGVMVAVAIVVANVPFGKYIFSGLSYTLIGAWLPIYESIRAVCSPDERDDKTWLQYWMVGGIFFVITTWVDDLTSSQTDIYWHAFLFCFFLWLYYPKTDGAYIIYEKITKPYLAPKVKPFATDMDNMIQNAYAMLMNVAHLWIVGLFFVFLPAGLKRIVAIAIGTGYPLVSSIGAAVSEEIEDDTYWLTYWSCYGILFITMDILENWIGWIPGFYALVICASVYLMLPMFNGADKVFRKVLVPLAGLKELLMLRDAIMIKKQMLKDLDPERAEFVRKAIAKFYNEHEDDKDPDKLKNELMTGYSNMNIRQLPAFSMPDFSGFKMPKVPSITSFMKKTNSDDNVSVISAGTANEKTHILV